MLRIAICDDERNTACQIREMTSAFFRARNMDISISQFTGGMELLSSRESFDILFLDIRMADLDGMETAQLLRKRGFKGFLIFLTALPELVFQSFEVQAYDYLLKPLDSARLNQTLSRLLDSMGSASEANLLIQRCNEVHVIPFEEIVFCEVMDRKIYLHLCSSQVIDYYDRIERLQNRLDDRFYRCHRSYLINLQYLKGYRNGIACLADGNTIPVSRLKGREFSAVVLQYMQKWRS